MVRTSTGTATSGSNRVVTAAALALAVTSGLSARAAAEPMLKLEVQPVAGRVTPPPLTIEHYHGSLRWGKQRLHFVAPGGELRWDAWTDPADIETVKAAMVLVEQHAVGNRRCNDYFALMPKGKTFDALWHATGPERIRVSFSPGPSGIWRSATYPYLAPLEWTVTEATVIFGPASVASALVHEAARSNGVGPQWRIAYGAEKACGVPSFELTMDVVRRLGWR